MRSCSAFILTPMRVPICAPITPPTSSSTASAMSTV